MESDAPVVSGLLGMEACPEAERRQHGAKGHGKDGLREASHSGALGAQYPKMWTLPITTTERREEMPGCIDGGSSDLQPRWEGVRTRNGGTGPTRTGLGA